MIYLSKGGGGGADSDHMWIRPCPGQLKRYDKCSIHYNAYVQSLIGDL